MLTKVHGIIIVRSSTVARINLIDSSYRQNSDEHFEFGSLSPERIGIWTALLLPMMQWVLSMSRVPLKMHNQTSSSALKDTRLRNESS